MEKNFESEVLVSMTEAEWTWLGTTGIGHDRFDEVTPNDREVLSWTTFTEFVAWVLVHTDLLVEHDEAHWTGLAPHLWGR